MRIFTDIYVYSNHSKKYLTRYLLTNIYNVDNFDNWIVSRDFNIVSSTEEKSSVDPIDLSITNKLMTLSLAVTLISLVL